MNKAITARLEKIYDALPTVESCTYYQSADNHDEYYSYTGGNTIRNAFDNALISYLLFLEHSKKISWIKIGFLKDYFSAQFDSTRDVSDFINRYSIFKKSFILTPPIVFIAFIENEKERFLKNKKFTPIPFDLFDFYSFIGKEYLVCDGSSINQEMADRYIMYLDLLETELKKRLPTALHTLIRKKREDLGC